MGRDVGLFLHTSYNRNIRKTFNAKIILSELLFLYHFDFCDISDIVYGSCIDKKDENKIQLMEFKNF